MSTRTRRVRKRPSRSSLLAGSPELVSVKIGDRQSVKIDAKPAKRTLPKAPHPANVASSKEYRKLIPEHERIDDIRAWVRERLAHMREQKPQTSFYEWCALETLADHIEKWLKINRESTRLISAKAVKDLQSVLETIRADLTDTRPF